jgi:hypothetical protein
LPHLQVLRQEVLLPLAVVLVGQTAMDFLGQVLLEALEVVQDGDLAVALRVVLEFQDKVTQVVVAPSITLLLIAHLEVVVQEQSVFQ